MSVPLLALAAACGYLAGSIPFGLVLLRLAGGPDPRTVGSGNIGATNVSRAGGRGLGLATLALDLLKGLAPALIFVQHDATAGTVAGLAAVVGHCHPVWLRFRGGKGVATFLGVAAALWPWSLAAFALAWVAVAAATRFVSLASVTGCFAAAVVAASLALGQPDLRGRAIALGLAALLVAARHASNLGRIRSGEEPRIGSKKEKTT